MTRCCVVPLTGRGCRAPQALQDSERSVVIPQDRRRRCGRCWISEIVDGWRAECSGPRRPVTWARDRRGDSGGLGSRGGGAPCGHQRRGQGWSGPSLPRTPGAACVGHPAGRRSPRRWSPGWPSWFWRAGCSRPCQASSVRPVPPRRAAPAGPSRLQRSEGSGCLTPSAGRTKLATRRNRSWTGTVETTTCRRRDAVPEIGYAADPATTRMRDR